MRFDAAPTTIQCLVDVQTAKLVHISELLQKYVAFLTGQPRAIHSLGTNLLHKGLNMACGRGHQTQHQFPLGVQRQLVSNAFGNQSPSFACCFQGYSRQRDKPRLFVTFAEEGGRSVELGKLSMNQTAQCGPDARIITLTC